MLDVNFGSIICITKLSVLFIIHVFGIYDIVLTLPPLKELEIFLKFCQIVEGDSVLLYLFIGNVVE